MPMLKHLKMVRVYQNKFVLNLAEYAPELFDDIARRNKKNGSIVSSKLF
jgi:hypothetical protein